MGKALLCGPAPCDGGTTTLIKEAAGSLFDLNEAATVEAAEENKKRTEKNVRKKERRGSRAACVLSLISSSFTVG
jgi:hypothetical protein